MQRVATFFQVYAKLFHEEFNKEFGCTLPSFGGLKIADEEGHVLCLNTSIYNSTRMYEVDSQLMFIIVCSILVQISSRVTAGMKAPCKASEIFYGVPELTEGNNSTRYIDPNLVFKNVEALNLMMSCV